MTVLSDGKPHWIHLIIHRLKDLSIKSLKETLTKSPFNMSPEEADKEVEREIAAGTILTKGHGDNAKISSVTVYQKIESQPLPNNKEEILALIPGGVLEAIQKLTARARAACMVAVLEDMNYIVHQGRLRVALGAQNGETLNKIKRDIASARSGGYIKIDNQHSDAEYTTLVTGEKKHKKLEGILGMIEGSYPAVEDIEDEVAVGKEEAPTREEIYAALGWAKNLLDQHQKMVVEDGEDLEDALGNLVRERLP